MRRRPVMAPLAFASAIAVVAAFEGPDPLAAQEEPEAPAPLLELGELFVGTWEDEGSRHVAEWGVGRRAIRTRSYALAGGGAELVSEGMWYWDGEAGVIRGVVVAVGMPVERFEYASVVRGREVVHELEAYGDMSGRFVETWTFEGDGYRWRLERPTEEGPERLMGGAYRKVAGGGG